MPQPETEFDKLIDDVRGGSQDAAWVLVERYSGKIRRVVRRCLPDQMRSKFDPLDFVQATWHSVFQHASRLGNFHKHEQFVGYIAGVATNKVQMEIRKRMKGQRYNVGREQSLERAADEFGDEPQSGDPTPSQVAVVRERWDQFLESQPDHYRQIMQMRFAGNGITEIAKELNLHKGTVQRALHKMIVAF